MEAVYLDLTNYLKNNIFPSRTVLIFPPFNGFRRFLIHKLIEDNFASSEVAAFSIGQDINRRIVVCFKGLLREDQKKSLPSLPVASGHNMIEKEKPMRQRSSPAAAAAVYKPPAARLAESKKTKDAAKPSDSKRTRRPDQQMYVPRPKRASYDNEQSRSQRHSSSRTSVDSSDEKMKSNDDKNEDSRLCEENATLLSDSCKLLLRNENSKTTLVESTKENDHLCYLNINSKSTSSQDCTTLISSETSCGSTIPIRSAPEELSGELENQLDESSGKFSCSDSQSQSEMEVDCCDCDSVEINRVRRSSDKDDLLLNNSKNCDMFISKDPLVKTSNENNSSEIIKNTEVKQSDTREEITCSKIEHMDAISVSSESTGSSSNTSSSSDSKSNSSSSDSESVKSHYKFNKDVKIGTDSSSNLNVKERTKDESLVNNSKQQNLKILNTSSPLSVSEVLTISDTSSSSDSIPVSTTKKKTECKIEQVQKQKSSTESQRENSIRKSRVGLVDPGECDWESLYDDSGECLVPSLMEELTNSVGKVRIATVDKDYRAFQSVEERTNDGECIIEIYDFPAEFKTTDLFNIFAAYRNRNFQIKWVDDTHALGVFPCPLIADEVLACTLPFVKTRPLRLGIAESRIKARNLVLPALPPMERPKTCTALARRLVSGALGLRLPTSSQEREKEKQMLKEAREKRRLEAKQRDAAWNGTLTSDNSC